MTLDIGAMFGDARVMLILRGVGTAAAGLAAAEQAWQMGVDLVEVPIGKPEDLAVLAAVASAGREGAKIVGAGTVISVAQVDAAGKAGARYTVAPGLDAVVAAVSQDAGLPHLPGAATATEVRIESVDRHGTEKRRDVLAKRPRVQMHGARTQPRPVGNPGLGVLHQSNFPSIRIYPFLIC
jgi:2-keto-3-deoxy-6-phosphogluconate aldolase